MNTQTAVDIRAFHRGVPDEELAELPVPTYLGRGDPAGAFANYYPAWVDNLADDVTLEGSMLDGAVDG
jgi:hypothetical protein